eukprot:3411035-Rhodomonas_salina.1
MTPADRGSAAAPPTYWGCASDSGCSAVDKKQPEPLVHNPDCDDVLLREEAVPRVPRARRRRAATTQSQRRKAARLFRNQTHLPRHEQRRHSLR